MSDKFSHGSNDERLGARKTRRLRKGTRSCWECKRRKIRCLYAIENDSTCRDCADRGTKCVSQEFMDEAQRHPAGNGGLGQRMGRIEDMLEKLMQKVSMNNVNDGQPDGSDPHLLPRQHGSIGADIYSRSASLMPQSDQNVQIGSLYDSSLVSILYCFHPLSEGDAIVNIPSLPVRQMRDLRVLGLHKCQLRDQLAAIPL
jgi:hypothetical protein